MECKPLIFASILSADLGHLAEEAASVIKAGADGLHVDVMDNHYVPNLSFGPLVAEALRRHLPHVLMDVHLMANPVDKLIDDFASGPIQLANQISFHPEASYNILKNLEQIRKFDIKAGLAINPETPLDYLETSLIQNSLDFVLLMSVDPGFAGQTFIPKILDKIAKVKALIAKYNLKLRLGVDGGIKKHNIKKVAEAGADTFILGSGIFHTSNYANTLTELRSNVTGKE